MVTEHAFSIHTPLHPREGWEEERGAALVLRNVLQVCTRQENSADHGQRRSNLQVD